MLTKNKFSKYLLYAIGEIILVVIGILIALNINNRNEDRKFNEGVITQLKLLSGELAEDIIIFDQKIENYPDNIDYLQKLSKGEYNDLDLSKFDRVVKQNDLKILFGDSYNILKNNGGINKIKDEDLITKLGIYNNQVRVILNQQLEYGMSSSLSFIDEKVLSFMEYDANNKLVESNTIKVIKEKNLNSIINFQLKRNTTILEILLGVSDFTKELKKQLDEYISAQES